MKKLCLNFILFAVLCGIAFLSGPSFSPAVSEHSPCAFVCLTENFVDEADPEFLASDTMPAELYELFFVPSKPQIRAFPQKRVPPETSACLTALHIAASGLDEFAADRVCSHAEIRFSLPDTVLADVIPARAGPAFV